MPNQSVVNVSSSQLQRAAGIKQSIERLEAELNRILGGETAGVSRRGRAPGRKMSAAARRKIATAQKARWARQRGGDNGKVAKKNDRRSSAAVRAKISAAAKRRWAKAKASGKTTL